MKDSKLYVGLTRQPIDKRLMRHNNRSVASTRNRAPFVLLYKEDFDNFSNARKRELYLKSGSGREHLQRILDKRAGTQSPYAHFIRYGGPAVA